MINPTATPLTTDHSRLLGPNDSPVLLADAGLETYLIYREGLDLPEFSAITALHDTIGRAALVRYYQGIVDVAVRDQRPLLLDTATWRASSDWGHLLGYSAAGLDEANAAAVALVDEVRREAQTSITIAGVIGPRGDGYAATSGMSPAAAGDYHAPQVASLASAGVEFIAAMTIADPNEAAGIVECARESGLPAVVSFTVETDGRLAGGATVVAAIAETDRLTGGYPAHYLLNCAHPVHLTHALQSDAPEVQRIRGLRVNASMQSHAELDAATTLEDGHPGDLGRRCAELVARHPQLTIIGGCCGTDARHISAISAALS